MSEQQPYLFGEQQFRDTCITALSLVEAVPAEACDGNVALLASHLDILARMGMPDVNGIGPEIAAGLEAASGAAFAEELTRPESVQEVFPDGELVVHADAVGVRIVSINRFHEISQGRRRADSRQQYGRLREAAVADLRTAIAAPAIPQNCKSGNTPGVRRTG